MKIISKKNTENHYNRKGLYLSNIKFYAAIQFLSEIINYSNTNYYINVNTKLFNSTIYDDLRIATREKEKFIQHCTDNNLFNKELYEKYKIFTNEDLQYSYRTELRDLGYTVDEIKSKFNPDYLLINLDDRRKNNGRKSIAALIDGLNNYE